MVSPTCTTTSSAEHSVPPAFASQGEKRLPQRALCAVRPSHPLTQTHRLRSPTGWPPASRQEQDSDRPPVRGTLCGNAPGRSGCIRGAVPDAPPEKMPGDGRLYGTGPVRRPGRLGPARKLLRTEPPWAHRLLELAAPRRQTVLLCATIAAQSQCSRTAPNGGYARLRLRRPVTFRDDPLPSLAACRLRQRTSSRVTVSAGSMRPLSRETGSPHPRLRGQIAHDHPERQQDRIAHRGEHWR
jgi:hypothetical protein